MKVKDSLFSNQEWLRYTRHIQLGKVGAAGQTRLKNATVLIVGAGGLGSPVSLYLAAAGVGTIVIVDGDRVDVTNLQRQILFSQAQVGELKADCAKQRLLALNPDIEVIAVNHPLSIDNAGLLIKDADLILDCTDNFATRYVINDLCAEYKKPWIFASIYQFSGQCALFTPDSACFRCLFPQPPNQLNDCNSAGVVGVLPGILGTFQANEAIKYLTGLTTPLENHLLLVEAMDLTFRKIELKRADDCVVCHPGKTTRQLQNDYQMICEASSTQPYELGFEDFERARDLPITQLLDVRSDAERAAFHIGGLHIPLDQIAKRLSEIPQHKDILCYCQSGVRSLKAYELLKDKGFKVKSLHKGLAGWVKCSL